MAHHDEKYYLELNRMQKQKIKIWKYCVIEREYKDIAKYIGLTLRYTKSVIAKMVEDGMLELVPVPGKPTKIRRLDLIND